MWESALGHLTQVKNYIPLGLEERLKRCFLRSRQKAATDIGQYCVSQQSIIKMIAALLHGISKTYISVYGCDMDWLSMWMLCLLVS